MNSVVLTCRYRNSIRSVYRLREREDTQTIFFFGKENVSMSVD